jgi:hypothetical protein
MDFMSDYIQPETTEFLPLEGSGSPTVSGNDTGGASDGNEGNPDTGDLGGTADGDASQTPVPDVPPLPDVPTPETPDTAGFMSDVLGSLDSIGKSLDEAPSYDSLAESLRSLVDVMTMQAEEEKKDAEAEASSPAPVPLADYGAYAYPVTVTYRLYPSGLASETEAAETYGTPEDFVSGYTAKRDAVEDGTLSWFAILSVDDAGDIRVYDSEATGAEASGEGEEPDTYREDVLAALDTLHGDLQSVSSNDLGFYGDHLDMMRQNLDLQEQCLALQQETRELHYHMLACDIATGFVLLLALGYTVAHGFFGRMKAG